MRWMSGWGLLLLVGAVAAGWHYRDSLHAAVAPALATLPATRPSSSPAPSGRSAVTPATREVLYTWVDDHGVTHFEQRPGKGKPVVLDGSHITPLEPVDPGQLERLRQAAAEPASHEPAQGGESSARRGTLDGVRDDMAAGAHAMKQSRNAANGL